MNGWRRRDFLGSATALAANAQISSSNSPQIANIEIHLPVGLLRIKVSPNLEGYCLGIGESTAKTIVDRCAPALTGQDPALRERIWQTLRSKKIQEEALAAIDIALWDLAGRILSLPSFRLAGGLCEKVPVCKIGTRTRRIDEVREQVVQAAKAGYAAFQDRFSGPVDTIPRLAEELQHAADSRLALIHSGDGRYDPAQALRAGQALQRAGYDTFEDPFVGGAWETLGGLSRSLDLPVSSPVRRTDVARALTAQFPDILRIDAIRHGGFTGLLKTLRAAEAFGVSCAVAGTGPLSGLVHAHAIAAARNARFFEEVPQPDESGVLKGSLPAGPAYTVPTKPGFGVELVWAEIERRTQRVLRA